MAQLNGHLNARRILSGDLYGGIATGTFNYNELENKPSINNTTLQGNITLNIPTATSDLTNDSGFITSSDIPAIPTLTSQLTNDSGFITSSDVPTATSELLNDSGFITSSDIPTNISAFNNDSGYVTSATAPVRSVNGLSGDVTVFVPMATSQLTNDAGFITSSDIPVTSVNTLTGNVVLTGNNVKYNSNTTLNAKIDSVEGSIPTKTSDLNNDSGFITSSDVPTATSDLINDSGFITSSDIPVTSVNTLTGDVVLDGSNVNYDANTTINAKINSIENSIPTDTATIENVSIATFNDGDYDKSVNELIIDIDANVNGYTEVNATVTGKNLIRPFRDNEFTFNGITVTPLIDGSIRVHGTSTSQSSFIVSPFSYSNVMPSGTYTFSIGNFQNYVYSQIVASGHVIYSKTAKETYTYNNKFSISRLDIGIEGSAYNVYIDITIYPQLEIGNQATTYESYKGTTYNIPLGQSITTGGELNVTTGELTITGGSTVTLTPTDVNTLIGYNNIYADSGNINKLTYYKLSPFGLYNWIKTQI